MKPNIFVIVIDSLRSKNLIGENKTSKTPNIDNLIKNGTSFSNAFSNSDGTVLSFASILSGVYPFRTGVTASSHYGMNSKVSHMATFFKKSGYHVCAKIPELIFLKGLAKKFENDDKYYNNYYELSQGFGKEIIEKLKSLNNKTPWLFYLHINDLHTPNWPSKKFDNQIFGSSNYDRVISEIDFWIGEFLKLINMKNTLVVLTADHGEYLPFIQKDDQIISFEAGKSQQMLRKFGAKLPRNLRLKFTRPFNKSRNKIISKKIINLNLSEYEKRSLVNTRKDSNFLFDELTNIPLIFCGANIKEQATIKNLVNHVDIFPTIVDLVDLEIPSNVDGTSLLQLLDGKSMDTKFVYFERDVILKRFKNDVIGIRNNKYKYFRSNENPTENVFLFDIINDPLEESNISDARKDIVIDMKKQLLEILKQKEDSPTSKTSDDEYSKKVEEELKKLGYL